MKLFLDTEFNGFGGKLMSMALVPEDKEYPEFYCEIEMKDQLDPWVRDNVVPHMHLAPVSHRDFQLALAHYLNYAITIFSKTPTTIVADWPDDIRYFCESLITGPGNRIVMLNPRIKFSLDMSLQYVSAVPHNALHDARGIRDSYLAQFK